jgi:DNA invertase Pin-like site-specific DNA recombinase
LHSARRDLCALSSDQQREASIEDQIRMCRARIEREGWSFQTAYTDHAISGANRFRPGYQKLLEDARAGLFDIVVAEALDRLSRDQEDTAALYKQLSFSDVKLITLAEGEISELQVGFKGTMNALFLKDLAQKTRRGLEGRVREGKSGGGIAYGYDVESAYDARGERIPGGRKINPAQAEIVRRIMIDYASGQAPRAIAISLNRAGIAGPSGAEWGPSTINGNAARGTGILNNELYIGRLIWNRLRYIKDPATGKRVSRHNPAEQWVTEDVPDLRIVSDELWQRVKARQASVAHASPTVPVERQFWEKQRPRYLVTGLAKCGQCGSSYVKISANLFGCAAARDRGTCDNRLNIRQDTLEAAILDGLKHNLMAPDVFESFCVEFHREVNRLRMDEHAALDAKRAERDKVNRRISKIVAMITDDDAPVRALKQELVALEARQQELERAIAGAAAPQPLIHPNLALVYRARVAALHEALHDVSTRAEAFDTIRSLIDEIRLVPDGDTLRIDLRGELAGILAIAANRNKPGSPSTVGLTKQIKMVAGARNHRERHLLRAAI